MNRANRRPATSKDDRREWAAGIAGLLTQAEIILDIRHFRPGDLVEVIGAAAVGSSEAVAILQAIRRTIEHVTDARPGLPALCGGCAVEVLGTPFLIVLASPHGRPLAKSVGLATTLCTGCQSDIPGNALAAFKRLWSEARLVTVHAPPEAV